MGGGGARRGKFFPFTAPQALPAVNSLFEVYLSNSVLNSTFIEHSGGLKAVANS